MNGRLLLWAVLLGSASIVGAQDLHFSALQWLDPEAAPDSLPVARNLKSHGPRDALREAVDPHYAEIRFLVLSDGQPSLISARSSTAWLEWSKDAEFLAAEFEPARRDGRPVSSEVVTHLIYNPASAAEDVAEATPRLLVVVPPKLPAVEGNAEEPERVLTVRAVVSASGKVIRAEADPDKDRRYEKAAEAAVRRWRFAPARRAGQPVEAEVRVPVIFEYNPVFDQKQVHVSPTIATLARPVYPPHMRKADLGGEVVVAFVVTVEGRVRNAYVVVSNNPGFDEAAIDVVEQWTFTPGLVDGRPVSTRMQVPIVFSIVGSRKEAFIIKKPRKWNDDVPENLRFDEPPKLMNIMLPNYPREALEAGVKGEVIVEFVIGPDGTVQKAGATADAPPELARAAVAAVEAMTFKPALRNGLHTSAAVQIELDFRQNGMGDAPVSTETRRLLRVIRKAPHELVPLAELDEVPAPLSRRPPVMPLSARNSGGTGDARIEFIIDRKGFARLPRILEASDPAFGYAAMQAISTWRFERPRKEGKAVDALAVIPVRFGEP